MATVENSLILAKMSKPLHSGQIFGVFSNGGEINIDGKFGIRVSKLNDKFFQLKIIHYGEVPAYKVEKFVKVVKEKVVVEKEVKPDKQEKQEFEMNVTDGGDLIDEL